MSGEDFDAWRATQPTRGTTATIAGYPVTLPPAMPAGLAARLAELQLDVADSADEAARELTFGDVRGLLVPLLGEQVVDALMARGYTVDDLGVLVAWGVGNVTEPGSVTFAQAAAQARNLGKAMTPAAPRTGPAPRRGGSGGRSSTRRR